MRRLIIVRGAQGSGKTTFADFLLTSMPEAVSLSADDWFANNDGSYVFKPEDLGRAHTDCRSRCEKAMRQDVPVIIVHNTFAKHQEVDSYMVLADRYNYDVFCMVMENRHNNKDIHGVPQHVRERIAQTITSNLKLV